MSVKYRLPAVITISLMMLIFCVSCNNVGSNTDVHVYTPEDSQKALEGYIVEDADGTYLEFHSANFKLEPKEDRIIPSAIAVKKAIAESGFYNKELFDTLKIYILPYRVPSIINTNKNVGGFSLVTDSEKIIGLFTMKDKDPEDLQQLVLHELGHIAIQSANLVELDDYSKWRLAEVKNTYREREIDGEINNQDLFAKYVLDPEEVVAEDFSFVYGVSINHSPQYENYLDSPLEDNDLKVEIRKRMDKLFNNQKVI